MTTTDLIIIGAGPGGYRAAAYAAANGLQVVLIERENLGGTCLNRGCIPTKTLVRNAEVLAAFAEAEQYGIAPGELHFDLRQAIARKDAVVEQLRSGIATLLDVPAITMVAGHATFVDSHTVEVEGEQYHAPHILIATGSAAKQLPIPMAEGMVCSSDQLLSATELPHHLCIIGAGVIGMEFASIYRQFGCEVTVIEFLKECLPALDSDIAKRLRKSLEKRGVNFEMLSAVKEVRAGEVVYEKKGRPATVSCDKVLMAVGRRPLVDGLSLENAGIVYSNKGIEVDGHLQTNVTGVYAIGDVNGRQLLAHAATMQGIKAVNHLLGRQDNIDLSLMPAAIFTLPEAASVGKSEDECKEQQLNYRCLKAFHRANGKALAMNETEGMVKLMVDNESDLILGCHAFGAHSADMIQEVSVLMATHATHAALREMIHIHPTIGEMLQEM